VSKPSTIPTDGDRSHLENFFAFDSIQTPMKTQPKKKKKRKSPAGITTNKLIFSAQQGTNDEIFPSILKLYVPKGSIVADITYGRGVFWRNVPKDHYHVLATDIKSGTDCRALPYENGTLNCVVFDPPYMHTPGGTAHVNHQNYENYYGNNIAANGSEKKYHEAVLDLYFKTALEAKRVLKPEGVFIVKCGDEVCANQQRLTHVELINEFSNHGFVVEDLFVLLRNNRPGVSRVLRQVHARKNHSYFMVFRKSKVRRMVASKSSDQTSVTSEAPAILPGHRQMA
jgi:hypothetical protein